MDIKLQSQTCIAVLLFFVPILLHAKDISISVQIQPNQRDRFEQLFYQFFRETGIKVVPKFETDLAYKRKVPIWLLEQKNTPDVMFWSASQRLYRYAKEDLILPITNLWNEQNYDQKFPHLKPGVTYDEEVYAVPFAYYHWGIFYRKKLVEEYGGPPQDWKSFISVLNRMKEDGLIPIGLGSKQKWPAAAWFDYINLRTNGLEFHLELLNGKISFQDEKVKSVFNEWKKLVDGQFFNSDHQSLNWDGVLPSFYRNRTGFLLLGNFVASKWPHNEILFRDVYDDIGFMPFPKIDETIPYYENAPTDIFLIPKSSKKPDEAKAFIRFVARADVQSHLNQGLGYLPANVESFIGTEHFVQEGANLFRRAEGLAQFFDRDTVPDFDKLATPLLADFISHGNVDDVMKKLEAARMKVFGQIKQ